MLPTVRETATVDADDDDGVGGVTADDSDDDKYADYNNTDAHQSLVGEHGVDLTGLFLTLLVHRYSRQPYHQRAAGRHG